MKVGIECEGRFKGLVTLFCDAKEFDTDARLLDLSLLPIQQIYISDHENVLNLNDSDLCNFHRNNVRITVERTNFDSAPYWINIMLVIDNESFWNLRYQDQIKFSKDLNVYSVLKDQMYYTDPADFKSDTIITPEALPRMRTYE